MTLTSLLANLYPWRKRRAPAAPSLEIHIPISPTATFLNMVRCFTLSLRRNGGAYRNAPVIATAGAERIDPTLTARNPWMAKLGIELRWAPEDAVRTHSYGAQVLERLKHEYRSDMVLLADADLLVAAPFDDMVRAAHRDGAVAAMIAPVSPLQFYPKPTTWDDLYAHCGLKKRPLALYQHPAWPRQWSPDAAYRYCPPYFNYGVVCLPSRVVPRIADRFWELFLKLEPLFRCDLNYQIALGMAVDELGVPVHALPVRYNFPNHPSMAALHEGEVRHARILHMKDRHQAFKDDTFRDAGTVRAFASRPDLDGINALAGRVLRAIGRGLDRGGPSLGAVPNEGVAA